MGRFGVGFALMVLLLAISLPRAGAQRREDWSPPDRLSSANIKASEGYSVADQFGFVHLFWTETLEDERVIIQYSRFDGESWSPPVDIHVAPPFSSIGNISPFVDDDGTLHIIWNVGDSGPAFYMRAPAYDALSAQSWQSPTRIDIPAKSVNLVVDSKSVIHVLFGKSLGQEPGVYYLRSEDQGLTWTDPVWLDPDILPDHAPRSMQFALDSTDGLHAAWYYDPRNANGGDWVRYTHSLDGGDSWALPFTIDRLVEGDEETGKLLSAAGPVMIVNGQTVHIIWAAGELHYRHHRFSEDAGLTWSDPVRILGNLNGQAFDGLAVDGDGRVHYFAQIRYPQGIYHSVWDEGEWTIPSLIYQIRNGPEDAIGDRIHAHNTYPVIRAGNQLVLTFADPPPDAERRLFAMTSSLDDVPAAQSAPTPLPSPTVTPEPSPTSSPPPATVAVIEPAFTSPPPESTTPGSVLWIATIPALLLAAGAIMIRLVSRSRH